MDTDELAIAMWSVGQNIFCCERWLRLIGAQHCAQRQNRGSGGDGGGVYLVESLCVLQNGRKLLTVTFDFVVAEAEPGQMGHMLNLFTCQFHGYPHRATEVSENLGGLERYLVAQSMPRIWISLASGTLKSLATWPSDE